MSLNFHYVITYLTLFLLCFQNPWFRKTRFKQGKGKKMNMGGKGLGFKERPGLGAETVRFASYYPPTAKWCRYIK